MARALRVPLLLAAIATVVAPVPAGGAAVPKPLHGVPPAGPTGLRLLVSDAPPLLVDVDTGAVSRVTGLNVRGNPVISVLRVGPDAVVWLDRPTPAGIVPRAEIYVVRHGTAKAIPIGTGWDVAPAAGGRAIWVLGHRGTDRCTLGEIGLGSRVARPARPVACSARLVDAGSRTVLVRGSSVTDPATGRTLLRSAGLWAISGRFALGRSAAGNRLTLTDIDTGASRVLPWPSRIRSADQAAVRPAGGPIALAFSDPAYGGGGTQVTDVWLLDPATGRFRHLPDMPAAVDLKFTSMAWTDDGRLVLLAEPSGGASGRNLVAVWRPGWSSLAVSPVELPARMAGSDTFVVR